MKAAVFFADGFEEVEAITIVDYLRRANVDVSVVAVAGTREVTGSHGIKIVADMTLDKYLTEASNNLPDAVYAPGGMPGSANLAASSGLISLFVKCNEAGKIVSALCAAPVVFLSKAGLLKDKKFTCYPGMENDIAKYTGADWQALTSGSQHIKDVPFVTDQNLVTGRGAGCAEQFAMELVRLLAGESVAQKLHDATVQR